MTASLEITKTIVRKVGGRQIRIDITGCYWCGTNDNAVCASCMAKADKAAAPAEPAQPAEKIITKYDPPPIPIRAFDWSAVTDNYEPGHPIGWGYTEQQAIEDLQELLADRVLA